MTEKKVVFLMTVEETTLAVDALACLLDNGTRTPEAQALYERLLSVQNYWVGRNDPREVANAL